MARWRSGGITAAARHHDLLLLADATHVWAADLELNALWRLAWPGRRPVIGCFLEDTLYWTEGDEVRYVSRDGRSGTFARLPGGLIVGAMDRYERMLGGAAAFARDFPFHWRLAPYDERLGAFFLVNFMPHLIVCLDRRGGACAWCECLGPGCCGGVPYALPDGRYVASGGCNGVLSWFDGDGNVLLQSLPHEGVGLATAYSNELQILPDGRALVDGGPGLLAYGTAGQFLWRFDRHYSQARCDSAGRLLVGCYWENQEPHHKAMTYLECVTGL